MLQKWVFLSFHFPSQRHRWLKHVTSLNCSAIMLWDLSGRALSPLSLVSPFHMSLCPHLELDIEPDELGTCVEAISSPGWRWTWYGAGRNWALRSPRSLLETILVFLLKVLCSLVDCFHSHQEMSSSLGVSNATTSCLWLLRWGVCWLVQAGSWPAESLWPCLFFLAQLSLSSWDKGGHRRKRLKGPFDFTVTWIAVVPMRKELCH